ncbi:MAG TPA: MFS transporter [Chloroflexota bacterium]|nr:MFS transporter [Chloroflexota bacterium]
MAASKTADHASATDRSAAWRALFVAWLGWMFDGYETYALVLVAGVAMRDLLPADQLAQAPVYIGGLLAATLVGWATGGVLAGVLADYLGRKRTLMLSIFCYAVFTGLTAFSQTFWMMLVFRFLTGLGLGAEWGPGTAMVAEQWRPAVRGRAAGMLNTAFGFGFLLASGLWLVVAPMGQEAWRLMFLFGIAPAFVLLYIRRSIENPELWVAADARRQAARARAARGEALRPEDHALLRFTMFHVLGTPELRRRLVLLLLMSLTSVVGWWATSTWIPPLAAQLAGQHGQDPQHAAAITGLTYNVGGILGYAAFGFLADAIGRKWSIFLYYLGALLIVWGLFLLVRDPGLFLVAAAVNGFFTSGQFSWMPTYLPEVFPTAVRGSAISLVFDSSRYLAAAGPLLAGWLITTLGGIGSAAAIIGTIYILGLVVVPFAAPETKGQPLPA